ncbi:MAG: alpha/beta fold hydrolase [Candidatus Lokiarchaeota archaeon]|nr:alpha/beta fold hydrolase [Candidatus Lokiarchaeota archaeon]
MHNIIFIHGLESSGDGFKGQLLRKLLPGCLTPNFTTYNPKIPIKNLLKERMEQLISILKDKTHWIIIGSSFGGLMGALFTLKYLSKVSKLILLAPYLSTPAIDPKKYSPVDNPVIVFHGKLDEVIPIKRSRARAEKIFTNLIYNTVDDDHSLKKTVQALDWEEIIKN